MTNEEIWEHQRREKAFRDTPIGGCFTRLKNKLARAWQLDGSDTVSDRRLREIWDEADAEEKEFRRLLAEMMNPPVAPAGDREAVDQEHVAFEQWAIGRRYNMQQHPLHYLFLDSKTYAARDGWKAALQWAKANQAALPAEERAAKAGRLREVLTRELHLYWPEAAGKADRIVETYFAQERPNG